MLAEIDESLGLPQVFSLCAQPEGLSGEGAGGMLEPGEVQWVIYMTGDYKHFNRLKQSS